MEKLKDEEIQKKIKEIPTWRLDGESIVRDWTFKDFGEAMVFVNQVAKLAEEHDHHPEMFNVYNKVTLRFSTHDAGGLTTRDFGIAMDIDRL
jgi:4a-hydroxytetrahydrobiopterin dehydratase